MTKVILLNGPRDVGKDFLADKFIDEELSARKLPVTWPLKLEAMAQYGIPPSLVNGYEQSKDVPINDQFAPHALKGRTPREVYIKYGTALRAAEGESAVAKRWRNDARMKRGYGFLLVPDVRFQPEVDEAVKEFGHLNVVLVHVRRAGRSWAGDIGSYVDHGQWFAYRNDGDGSSFNELVRKRTG